MGLLVHVVPRDPHHLDQVGLDGVVPGDDPLGDLMAAVGEVDERGRRGARGPVDEPLQHSDADGCEKRSAWARLAWVVDARLVNQ